MPMNTPRGMMGAQATEEELKRYALMQIMDQGALKGMTGAQATPAEMGRMQQGPPPSQMPANQMPQSMPGAGRGREQIDPRLLQILANRGR